MDKEHMLALFVLAGIEVKHADELPNNYWPRVPEYQELRDESPWWLVQTEFGAIKIGWRKRVISVDWERTSVRAVVTEDEVTKGEDHVHAWTYAKAVEYLTRFQRIAKENTNG